jgi:hypothetical protein
MSLTAWCHAQRAVYNWTDALDEERAIAVRLTQRAAAISRDDPMVLAILGGAHTVARDFGPAGEHLERALSLDPNSAWAWNRSGWLGHENHVYNPKNVAAPRGCYSHGIEVPPNARWLYISSRRGRPRRGSAIVA